jgi:hypothetical protein
MKVEIEVEKGRCWCRKVGEEKIQKGKLIGLSLLGWIDGGGQIPQ